MDKNTEGTIQFDDDIPESGDTDTRTAKSTEDMTTLPPRSDTQINAIDDISQSNMPDEIESDTALLSEDPAMSIPPRRTWVKWLIGIIFLILLAAGGIYGAYYYDNHVKESSILEILPGGSDIALRITINAEAEQYTLLESTLEKIPGYHIVKKSLDDTGTGRTLSEHLRATLTENNLDYDADIKAVLGNEAMVLIPDVVALRDSVLDSVPGNIITASMGDGVYRRAQAETSEPRGEFDTQQTSLSGIDFIMTAPVKDVAGAKRVLEKMVADTEKYTATTKKAHGIRYVYIQEKVQGENSITGIGSSYHALIGGHWVLATREDYITDALARKKSRSLFAFLGRPDATPSLSEDATFRFADMKLTDQSAPNLISLYYNLNLDALARPTIAETEDSLTAFDEYFQYPEQYAGGFALRVDEKGLITKSVSQDTSVSHEDIQNTSTTEGMVAYTPSTLNEKFGDVYVEYDNLQSIYYSFKKNGLTEKGIAKLNELRDETRSKSGLDFETDIIDQIDGETAMVLFARKDLAPEGALLMHVSDPVRMRTSIEKGVTLLKGVLTESEQENIVYCEELIASYAETIPDFIPFGCDGGSAKLDAINTSSIIASDTEVGTIYSYNVGDTDISFDFGFTSENILIFASNFATVESMLRAMREEATTFATDDAFQATFTGLENEGFAVSYMKTLGLWNAAHYMFNYYMTDAREATATLTSEADIDVKTDEVIELSPEMQAFKDTSDKKTEDILFLIESYAHVFDSFASINKIESEGDNLTSAGRVHINALPPEDLTRANAILDRL